MLWGFSQQARDAMACSHQEATSRGHEQLVAAHVLAGVAQTAGSGAEVLDVLGLDKVELVALCRGRAPIAGEPTEGPLPFGGAAREMLSRVADAMQRTGHRTVYSAHLLLALFAAGHEGRELFELVGVDEVGLFQAVSDVLVTSSEVADRGRA